MPNVISCANVCTVVYAGLHKVPQGKSLRIAASDQSAQVGVLPLPFNDHVRAGQVLQSLCHSYFICPTGMLIVLISWHHRQD